MHILSRVLPLLSAGITALLTPVGVNAGGFLKDCELCLMWNGHNKDMDGHMFGCYCDGARSLGLLDFGTKQWTYVHLNEMIGNHNGTLTWGLQGYRATCVFPHLADDGHTFSAQCAADQGDKDPGSVQDGEQIPLLFLATAIDLNKHISCVEGTLVFDA